MSSDTVTLTTLKSLIRSALNQR